MCLKNFNRFGNAVVEINQFSFGKPVDVDPHDYSNSHDGKRRFT
jgi:hypothetical protein